MKKKTKIILLSILLVVLTLGSLGFVFSRQMIRQTNNEDPTLWEKDIIKIENRYDNNPNVDIIFIGSSSIRKWESLDEVFSNYKVVNHGFGGSKIADSTYYYDRLVTPFNPEAIVIFAGTNDIHGVNETSKTGEEVLEQFKKFYEKSQSENPDIPVYYISISPTKARWVVWSEANKANNLISEYSQTQEKLVFIDTTDELLKDGKPNKDTLSFDGLHLNDDGYKIWADIIKPIVISNLDK